MSDEGPTAGQMALRRIALTMLSSAHEQRNEAERRYWKARDRVIELRLQYLDAQAAEAFAKRQFDRDQELLEMVWSDIRPLGSRSSDGAAAAEVEPVPA